MNPIPSRNLNPFAACWVRPGRIPYSFDEGHSVEGLAALLRANGWRGEIDGPHGAGKSTLLATLLPHLKAERSVHRFIVERGQRRLPQVELTNVLRTDNPLLVVDGFDELSAWQRRWWRWRIRAAGGGLLVTSHTPTGLPHLATLTPDLDMVRALVSRLLRGHVHDISDEDVAASFARHDGNVREILFDLYDRHERYRRSQRTPAAAGSY